MTTTADVTIAALRSGNDDLAAFVRDLTPDQLTAPSGASEWDVSQVLSHLGSGAVISQAVLEASLAGEANPGNDFNKSVWAKWDAMLPADRAAGFLEANEAYVSRLESLDADTRATQLVDMGFMPAPVDMATFATFRLSEFSFHAWDVRVGFDPDATLAPQATPLLVNFIASFGGRFGKAEALGGRQSTLRVATTDPDRTFTLQLGEQITIAEEDPATSDGTLNLPTEAFLRLAVGRLMSASGAEISGDVTLDDLRRVFPGF